jgi:hypothetical protein
VDFSSVAVQQCRAAGHQALVASVESLPFPDASFHTVIATEVLEHVNDLDAALAELHRVAWRQVIVTVPPNLASQSHNHVWPLERWRQALRAGAPDFFDGIHAGWALPRNPSALSAKAPLRSWPARVCFDGNNPAHEFSSMQTTCRRDHLGLAVRTSSPEAPKAHVFLGKGAWAMVPLSNEHRCDHKSFYVCHLDAAMPQGMTARLLVVWYDKEGKKIRNETLAKLLPDACTFTSAFAPAPDASYFGLVIHLKNEPPEHELIIRQLKLDLVSLEHRRGEIPAESHLNPVIGSGRGPNRQTEAERRIKRHLSPEAGEGEREGD